MNGAAARFVRLGASLAGLVLLAWVLTGQAAKPAKHRVSLPTDWSHSHIIFSQPQTAEEYARLANEPRYWQQLYRRQLPAAAAALAPPRFRATMHRDWAVNLGTGATMGPGNYPAKFGFDLTKVSCTNDFAVYSTGLQSSGTQASVVGFNNLYSGCTGSPTVNWAYDTAGQILTSPVPSLDGTQVAFVQTNAALLGTLVVMKWAPGGSIGSPATPTTVAPASYLGCTAPCMTTVTLRDGFNAATDDRTSSVLYDYKNDIIWVGGERGWLHKITGVFKGTPTEVHGGGFPVQVSTATTYNPVFDSGSNNVFIGDASGFLYAVNATSAAVTTSGQLDFGAGLVEAPVVDLTKGLLYVFASSDGSTNCTGGVACTVVYQLSTTFSAGATGTGTRVGDSVLFGSATVPNVLYIGGFDSAYYNSPNRTGTLYVCGNTGGNPTLYQVHLNAGAMPTTGNPITSLTTSSSTASCSPVTDVPNPSGGGTSGIPAERVFVSVQNNGLSQGCSSGGCILNFVSAEWQASTVYAVGQQILDSGGRIQTVSAITLDDKSGTTVPNFGGAVGGFKTDNHVTWINQGLLDANTLNTWQSGFTYALTARIIDSAGNVEVCTQAGTSGSTQPSWPAIGQPTTGDGTVNWVNTGPVATFSLAASGGTSGIIFDNVVSQTMQVGASQVYFTTLSNQACSGGTGGCAVQASQPELQ